MPQNNDSRARPGVGQSRVREISGVEFRAVDGEDRTFELSFSSEAPVSRWWGVEILSHEETAPKLDRLNDGGVLLYNHRTDIESVLGPVIKAWVDPDSRKCRAIVKFDTDEDAERVFQKVQSGTLKNVSVAYSVDAYEEVLAGAKSSNGRFDGPCEVITAWTAYEVTICPVPADATVGVGRNAEAPTPPSDGGENNTAETREVNMPQNATKAPEAGEQVVETTAARQADVTTSPAIPVAQIENQARSAERQRTTEILALCRELDINDAKRDEWLSGNHTIDQVNRDALEILKERNKPSANAPRVEVGTEQADKFRGAAAHAMMLRAGYSPEQLRMAGIDAPKDAAERTNHQIARQLSHMSLRSLMEEDARLRGKMDAARWSVDVLMRDVFTPDSAFVSILDNTVNSAMLIGHQAAQTTFQLWTKPGSLPNLKDTKGFRLSEAAAPKEIQQNGEFEWDTMTDEGIVRSLKTYAIGWGLTEDAIINDDLGVITDMPMAYAIACRREINAHVYSIINLNPAIYDGHALFDDANHGNLAGTGAAPTVSSLSAARAAMMAQKGIRGLQALNIQPRFILLGTDVQTAGEQLIVSITDPASDNANVPNPAFVRGLLPISDGEIADTNSWVTVADPNIFGGIGVDYLNGQQEPTIERRDGFRTLGIEWRLKHRWGVTVNEYRSLYRNAGVS